MKTLSVILLMTLSSISYSDVNEKICTNAQEIVDMCNGEQLSPVKKVQYYPAMVVVTKNHTGMDVKAEALGKLEQKCRLQGGELLKVPLDSIMYHRSYENYVYSGVCFSEI